jgi:hypothetical protein
MRGKGKRPRLTVTGLHRLLQRTMRNYRDVAAAVDGMCANLQPHLLPGTMPATDHHTVRTPVQQVEMITGAVLKTLYMYEGLHNALAAYDAWEDRASASDPTRKRHSPQRRRRQG